MFMTKLGKRKIVSFIFVVGEVRSAIFEFASCINVPLFSVVVAILDAARQNLVFTLDQLFKMSNIFDLIELINVFWKQKAHFR